MRLEAGASDEGKRLDHFLQDQLREYSRSRLQDWIKQGKVIVDGLACTKPSAELEGGEVIDVEPVARVALKAVAEDVPVDVVYEDGDLLGKCVIYGGRHVSPNQKKTWPIPPTLPANGLIPGRSSRGLPRERGLRQSGPA